MFMPGYHSCDVNVGYYTEIRGLDVAPTGTVIKNLWSSDSCGNALCNFWRAVENVQLGNDSGTVSWHVSQAAPMRRTYVKGNITLG